MNIELSRQELAFLTGGFFTHEEGPPNIWGISSLEHAKAQEIAFIFDASSLPQLKTSTAGYLVAHTAYTNDRPYLIVKDPLDTLATLIHHKKKSWTSDTIYSTLWPHAYISINALIEEHVTIEPGVIVKSGSKIGAHTILKAYSYIDHAVTIGNNCTIGPHVTIHNQTTIGNNVQIDDHTAIGTDGYGYKATHNGFIKIPHAGNVIIEDLVEIGASTTIDRALFDSTYIAEGCKIDNHVYIAHNVRINAHALVLGHVIIGGSTVIGNRCRIGAQTAIKDHITIGDYVDVVGKSGIMNNIESKQTIAGFPAGPFFAWKKQMVSLKKLPSLLKHI